MLSIRKKYIINEENEKVAVQLDIKTFEKIERLLEDFVLGEKIKENDEQERLKISDVDIYYKKLKKAK